MDNEKLTQLERKINQQSQEIADLKSKSDRLQYNMDNVSKNAVENIMIDRIMGLVWNNYFYYSSTFESIDRYYTPATGAIQTITDQGMVLQTTAIVNNETGFLLKVASSDLLSIEREAKFRVENKLDSTSNVNWEALTLQNSTATQYIGFRMYNGTMYGLSNDGTTLKTTIIGTYSVNVLYTLELHYYPHRRIVFYVDGIEKGVIVDNLPTAVPERIFDIGIYTANAAAKQSITTYFEFIQRK